ncbi:MAG TPA: HAMP domain-containing sensor histidine kinase [Desulfobulbus sp.]|nr:HAMP domain-containing sensor histidine kinase [Desulfobulbus sp.]
MVPDDKSFFIAYHGWEEFLIALICLSLVGRMVLPWPVRDGPHDADQRERIFLVSSGYGLLAVSSAAHAFIHFHSLNLNILYLTLFGYCLALLSFIVAISSATPRIKRLFPILYLLLAVLLVPAVYEQLPSFGKFRPLVWIGIAFLSGHVCILHVAAYYRLKSKRVLLTALGFLLICISGIFLFFPASIGSTIWIYGHLFRPFGFVILWLAVDRDMVLQMGGSILYRVLTAFSLLSAIPMLTFGTVVFYVNIDQVNIEGRRLLVFLLMLATFTSVLVFGVGMIIRLIRPILRLKESVDRLADHGLGEKIAVDSNDEIGELSQAFNEMVEKLSGAMAEQERLYRLAATGEMAATLAHEIKNPLNAINGATNYIGRNYEGALIREFTSIITEEVSRINRLTHTLLGFAKPLKLERSPADINSLVREIFVLLGREADEQGIVLDAVLDRNIPEIHCDSNQIKQILINLIINAFDAIRGRGSVIVTTRMRDHEILISVTDSGPGIDDSNVKNVFHPFFTTKTRGTGLGLAISQKIARGHDGDLVLECKPGHGCTFTLVLPAGDR